MRVRDAVDDFQLRGTRIVFEERRTGRIDRRISFWPPGYSSETRTAVVKLVYTWSVHHGEATFSRLEHDGRWVIGLRQRIVYP